MATLHLLGTGAGISSGDRTTTMLAFQTEGSTLVVDCGGDVVQRLQAGGVNLDEITGLVVTHEHPDHCAGFPLFMEKIWLSGRRRPIPVFGPEPALAQARRTWASFNTASWNGMPEIRWTPVPLEQGAVVLDDEHWRVTAAPGTHSVPVIGLRVQARSTGRSVAYSCDTERSEAIGRLAQGAHLLVHEGTGAMSGHTSMPDAAEVAASAGVDRLILVHLPPEIPVADLAGARARFPATELGADGATYPF